MTFGEKVWEDTGKVISVSIKSVGTDGVNVEVNYSGEFKGFGTLSDGTFVGTVNRMQKSNGISVGTDQGILTTKAGENVIYKGPVTGKLEGSKNRDVTTYTLMTASQKLGWLNSSIVLREGEADRIHQTFQGTAYTWE